jgi:hypothetical protein
MSLNKTRTTKYALLGFVYHSPSSVVIVFANFVWALLGLLCIRRTTATFSEANRLKLATQKRQRLFFSAESFVYTIESIHNSNTRGDDDTG